MFHRYRVTVGLSIRIAFDSLADPARSTSAATRMSPLYWVDGILFKITTFVRTGIASDFLKVVYFT